MRKSLSWGIIGTGTIASIFANHLKLSKTGTLLAVASRKQASADYFSHHMNVARSYGSYEQLLVDEDVDVVYIALPHKLHAPWAIKAIEAGKHVVCEKPLALNYAEAFAIVTAAQKHQVFLLEAFMYRFHPQTQRLVELIRQGTIGNLQMMQMTFSILAEREPQGRLWSNHLGGGSIMDLGCYCTSFARLIAGAATGKAFAEPIKVSGVGYIGDTNVDEYAIASLEFPEGILANIFCSLQTSAGMSATIYGSEGSISILQPFTPIKAGKYVFMLKLNKNKSSTTLLIDAENTVYALEADRVFHALDQLQTIEMTLEDTLGNMRTLDMWRAAIGLVYE